MNARLFFVSSNLGTWPESVSRICRRIPGCNDYKAIPRANFQNFGRILLCPGRICERVGHNAAGCRAAVVGDRVDGQWPWKCSARTPADMQPILAPDCHRADRVFGQIIRELQLPVVQKAPQLTPAAQGIIACFAQSAARERRSSGRFNPLRETFNDRFGFFPPQTKPFCGP